MQSFVVTLDRPRALARSLEEGVARTRAIVDHFRRALQEIVVREGLAPDLGAVEPTEHLPVLFVTGTDRLAERMRSMTEVRSVARDVALPYQLGEKSAS